MNKIIPWYQRFKAKHVFIFSFACLLAYLGPSFVWGVTGWVIFDYIFLIGLIVGCFQLYSERKNKVTPVETALAQDDITPQVLVLSALVIAFAFVVTFFSIDKTPDSATDTVKPAAQDKSYARNPAATEWRVFNNAEDGFSAAFPSVPTRNKQEASSEYAKYFVEYSALTESARYFVNIEYLNLDSLQQGNLQDKEVLDGMLTQATNGYATVLGGRLVDISDVTLAGNSSKLYKIQKDTFLIEGVIAFVESKLMNFGVAYEAKERMQADPDKFLNSLTLE